MVVQISCYELWTERMGVNFSLHVRYVHRVETIFQLIKWYWEKGNYQIDEKNENAWSVDDKYYQSFSLFMSTTNILYSFAKTWCITCFFTTLKYRWTVVVMNRFQNEINFGWNLWSWHQPINSLAITKPTDYIFLSAEKQKKGGKE